jgi:hypothetical protein
MYVNARATGKTAGSMSGMGQFLIVVGVVFVVHVIQSYVKHMTPIVSEQQTRLAQWQHMSADSYFRYWHNPGPVTGSDTSDSSEVRQVITSQFTALNDCQAAAAIKYATQDYRNMPADLYYSSIKEEYPELFSVNKLSFGRIFIQDEGHFAVQEVCSIADDGNHVWFMCYLTKEAEGWRVRSIAGPSWSDVRTVNVGSKEHPPIEQSRAQLLTD